MRNELTIAEQYVEKFKSLNLFQEEGFLIGERYMPSNENLPFDADYDLKDEFMRENYGFWDSDFIKQEGSTFYFGTFPKLPSDKILSMLAKDIPDFKLLSYNFANDMHLKVFKEGVMVVDEVINSNGIKEVAIGSLSTKEALGVILGNESKFEVTLYPKGTNAIVKKQYNDDELTNYEVVENGESILKIDKKEECRFNLEYAIKDLKYENELPF